MKYSICILCTGVSGLWFLLSIGIAWGYLDPVTYLLPTALLMGGSVIGIANRMKTLPQKILAVMVGMSVAYTLLINLNKTAIIIETIMLAVLAQVFFRVKRIDSNTKSDTSDKLTKMLDNCCD
ncbi:MAG: hypothetical protein AAB690_00840 [Patescibacteria group bacterium]